MYILCKLSCGTVATNSPYFSTRVLKSITLRTKRGTVLQTINPAYTISRIDEIYGTSVYNQIFQGLEPDGDFSGTTTCVIPLFFFFSEGVSTFLQTRMLEQLELECIVADTRQDMTLSADLTSAKFELYTMYFDEHTSNKFYDQILTTKAPIERALVGSYDTFYEDTVVCSAGSTSARLLLRCPFPLFNLHLSLQSYKNPIAGSVQKIKTVKITTGGTNLIEFDHRMNYAFSGEQKSFNEVGTLVLWFSKNRDRTVDSGLITFNEAMFPVYLDITFDSSAYDYVLSAFAEYRTYYKVSEKGEIAMSSMYDLDQLNSSTAPAYLSGGLS